jgi:hypothetical protein
VDGSLKLFKTLEVAMKAVHAAGKVPHEAPRQLVALVESGGGETRFPKLPFWAQEQFVVQWTSQPRKQMVVVRLAALLHNTVCAVLTEIYGCTSEFIRTHVGLCYLETLRANFSVALRMESGMMMFNVRALEQQLRFKESDGTREWWGCDIDGGGAFPALTPRFKEAPRLHRRFLRYWMSRVSMVHERKGATINCLKMFTKFGDEKGRAANAENAMTPLQATWMYNSALREQFVGFCERRGAPKDPPPESRRG